MRLFHSSRRSKKKKKMGNLVGLSCFLDEEEKKACVMTAVQEPNAKQRRTWHGMKLHSSSSHYVPPPAAAEAFNDTMSSSKYRTTWHGPRSSSSQHHHEGQHRRPRRPRIHHGHPSVLKSVRQGTSKVAHKATHAVTNFFQAIEEFLFPRIHTNSDLWNDNRTTSQQQQPRVKGGVLLQGCTTAEEHKARILEAIDRIKDLHSREGLEAIGLEYRMLPCEAHTITSEDDDDDDDEIEKEEYEECDQDNDDDDENSPARNGLKWSDVVDQELGLPEAVASEQPDLLSTVSTTGSLPTNLSTQSLCDLEDATPSLQGDSDDDDDVSVCHCCMRRLYHIESNTLVTLENRRLFIADGDMYEQVARLCQEYAHEVMCEEADLEWVTIEDMEKHDDNKEPIRALVNANHPFLNDEEEASDMADRPTLLIATGRGRVRAGIFSRQHLISSGMESATALPIVREARMRRLNVVVVDPNVHGDAMGFVTFEKSMDFLSQLFGGQQQQHERQQEEVSSEEDDDDEAEDASSVPFQSKDLYVLSHSASGGHLARYLLDKSDHYLPHIRAIAFTDSTHNIQWAKNRENDELYDMLESNKCVYFRCSNVRQEDTSKWYLHRAGEHVHTDSFWRHRFGKIKTYWAGTNEHSLTNWYAHSKIWEHFDRHLLLGGISEEDNIDEEDDPFVQTI